MTHGSHTPEQRRRMAIPRKSVFTASMAGQEIQRRFLLGQRLFFTFGVLFGLAAMWAMLVLLDEPLVTTLRLPLFGAAAVMVALAVAFRRSVRIVQVASFFLAFLCLGAAVGTLTDHAHLNVLWNVIIVVGGTVLGCTLNTALFGQHQSSFRQFLLVSPWFVGACAAAWFFPAGELVLALSGATAVIFVFLMQHASDRSLQLYHPSEVVLAAADVVPIAFVSVWHAWTGQN